MTIEYELRDGLLSWIKNPITGVMSYVVDVRDKSFAFTLGAQELKPPPPGPSEIEQMELARALCPFCPGNESKAPSELMRVEHAELPAWRGASDCPWVMRVFNNLFPRIPIELTGGRNESYVLVEDPRHFGNEARLATDLLYSGALGRGHFVHLLQTAARVTARALDNPTVRSVVVRKNQGRESGASQPHLHMQIIGAPVQLPVLAAEIAAEARIPDLWHQLLTLFRGQNLFLEESHGVITYANPIGAFPRSYDVIMPDYRGFLTGLSDSARDAFAGALYRLLALLGPIPLDYEIHQSEEIPLHAHLNVRRFPYSNVAGTLNLPKGMLDNVAQLRRALANPHR